MVRGKEAHIVHLCPSALLIAQQVRVTANSRMETLESEWHFESGEVNELHLRFR
jgi:hypothetical protein